MTDVPNNRTSQMAEFKQTEEVYRITVFFNTSKFFNIQYTSYKFFISTVNFEVLKKYRHIVNFLSLFKIRPSGTLVIWDCTIRGAPWDIVR